MEQTPIIPTLLPATAKRLPVEFFELTEEEAKLRHRLELKVERAFFRAAVIWEQLCANHAQLSSYHCLKHDWRNDEKVKRALSEAAKALGELRARQLYRATHREFDHYVRERFGSFVEEYSPAPDIAPENLGVALKGN